MKQLFNTTIKAGLVAVLMMGAGAPAMAQQADKPAAHAKADHKMDRFKNMTVAERVEKRLQQMDKQLELSDAQVAQLRPILTEDMQRLQNAREAMKAARAADKAQDKNAREAARADMKAQLQVTKDRISAVLTPEQREKAQARMKTMRENVRLNMQERHGKQRINGEQRNEMKQQLRQEKKLEKQNAK